MQSGFFFFLLSFHYSQIIPFFPSFTNDWYVTYLYSVVHTYERERIHLGEFLLIMSNFASTACVTFLSPGESIAYYSLHVCSLYLHVIFHSIVQAATK